MQQTRINTLVIVLSILLVVCLGAVGIVSFAHSNAVNAEATGWTDPDTGVIWDSEEKNEILYLNANHQYFMKNNALVDYPNQTPALDLKKWAVPDASGNVTITSTNVLNENAVYINATALKEGALTINRGEGITLKSTITIYVGTSGAQYIRGFDLSNFKIGTGFPGSGFFNITLLNIGSDNAFLRYEHIVTTPLLHYVNLTVKNYSYFVPDPYEWNPNSMREFDAESFTDVTGMTEAQMKEMTLTSCYDASGKIIVGFRYDSNMQYKRIDASELSGITDAQSFWETTYDIIGTTRISFSYVANIDVYTNPHFAVDMSVALTGSTLAKDVLSNVGFTDNWGQLYFYLNAWQVSDTFIDTIQKDMTKTLLSSDYVTEFKLKVDGGQEQTVDFNTYKFEIGHKYTITELSVHSNDEVFVDPTSGEGISLPLLGYYICDSDNNATITTYDANQEKTATVDWTKDEIMKVTDYTGGKVTILAPTVTTEDGTPINVQFVDATEYLTPELQKQGYKVAEHLNGATNAGKYIVAVAVVEGQGNIVIDESSVMYFTFEIVPVQLTPQWSNTTVTYNGQDQSPTLTLKTPAGVPADVEFDMPVYRDAGTYQVNVELTGIDSQNYTLSSGTLFTINKVDLTVEWADPTSSGSPQGGDAWNIQFADPGAVSVQVPLPTVSGTVNQEVVTLAFLTGDGNYTVAQSHAVVVKFADEAMAKNYTLTNDTKVLNITIEGYESVEVVWEGETTAVYTGSAITLPTATATQAGESVSLNVTITKNGEVVQEVVDAGTYVIEVTLQESVQVTLTNTRQTFTVTPAEVTLEWPANTFTYNGKAQSAELPTAKDVNGNPVALQFVGDTAPSSTGIGTISFQVEPVSGNYTISGSATGQLVIQKLVIDTSTLTAVYQGQAFTSIEYVISDGVTVTLNVIGTDLINVGTYDVTVVFATTNANVALSATTGKLTITPYELTLNWGELSFDYTGEAITVALPSLTGLLLGEDTATLSFTTNNSFTEAGDYTVTVAIDNANYTVANATQTVKIVDSNPGEGGGETPTGGDNTALIVTLSVVGAAILGGLIYVLVVVIKKRASK